MKNIAAARQAGVRRAIPSTLNHSAGFTLVELLLSVSVVLLLVGAVVFSFSSLQTGSRLEEGTDRFENLVRLARAEAASTGRRVQIVFREEVTEEGLPVGNVAIWWEPDPLGRPGQFELLRQLDRVTEELNEMVAIDSSRVEGAATASFSFGAGAEAAGVETASDAPAWLSPMTFLPDGWADSAEVMLVSRDVEDARRALVRIEGVTGTIRSRVMEPGDPSQKSPVDAE